MTTSPTMAPDRQAAPVQAVDRRWRGLAVALVSVVLLAGVASVVAIGDDLRYPDEREYLRLTRRLVDDGHFGFGASPSASRPPGYPFLLAPFVALGLGTAPLRLVNFACLGATAYLVFRLVRRRAPLPYAYLAAAGIVLYPFGLYAAGTFYPQVPATLPLVGALLLLDGALGRPRLLTGALVGAGLLFGVSILMVPNHAFLALVAAAWAAVVTPKGRAVVAGVLLASTVALPLTWTMRNLVRFDEVVLVSTNSGINLLLGNSRNAGPNTGVNADISRYEAVGERMDEFDRDRYYREAAIEWITDHPGDALSLYLRKVGNYFNFRNDLYVDEERSAARDLAAAVTYLPLLALLVGRLCLLRRVPLCRLESLIVLLYLSNALFLAIFFTRVRFRLPLDLLLIAGLCIFLGRAVPAWRRPGLAPGAAGS